MFLNGDDTVPKAMEACSMRSKSYLKEYFSRLSRSPTAFFVLRHNFAFSWASLQIASYILGIGDRHNGISKASSYSLENFLINTKNGRVIAIDFGHAFGSATEILPIPELVPIRISPQIQEFFEPLGVNVLLKPTMNVCLAALSQNSSKILNSLDVFIQEPLMEWTFRAIKGAQHQQRGLIKKAAEEGDAEEDARTGGKDSSEMQGTSSTRSEKLSNFSAAKDAGIWYPKLKLEIASRKLRYLAYLVINVDWRAQRISWRMKWRWEARGESLLLVSYVICCCWGPKNVVRPVPFAATRTTRSIC